MSAQGDPIALLRRWSEAGAVWRVLHRTDRTVTVALYRSDGTEEVDRFKSQEP